MYNDVKTPKNLMDIIEIRRMLAEGFCNLQYVKKDGTTRAATGTTCLELIPAFHRPKGVRPNEREGLVNYFDYSKLAWRCFYADDLLKIEENAVLNAFARGGNVEPENTDEP